MVILVVSVFGSLAAAFNSTTAAPQSVARGFPTDGICRARCLSARPGRASPESRRTAPGAGPRRDGPPPRPAGSAAAILDRPTATAHGPTPSPSSSAFCSPVDPSLCRPAVARRGRPPCRCGAALPLRRPAVASMRRRRANPAARRSSASTAGPCRQARRRSPRCIDKRAWGKPHRSPKRRKR